MSNFIVATNGEFVSDVEPASEDDWSLRDTAVRARLVAERLGQRADEIVERLNAREKEAMEAASVADTGPRRAFRIWDWRSVGGDV